MKKGTLNINNLCRIVKSLISFLFTFLKTLELQFAILYNVLMDITTPYNVLIKKNIQPHYHLQLLEIHGIGWFQFIDIIKWTNHIGIVRIIQHNLI